MSTPKRITNPPTGYSPRRRGFEEPSRGTGKSNKRFKAEITAALETSFVVSPQKLRGTGKSNKRSHGQTTVDPNGLFVVSPFAHRFPAGCGTDLQSLFPFSPSQSKHPTHYAGSSFQVRRRISSTTQDFKRNSQSTNTSGSGRPKRIVHSPIKPKIKISNESKSKAEPSACSSFVRIPASSFNSPPRSPKETTQGTPPRSNQGGLTTNGKNKTVYIDQINKMVSKTPYSLNSPKSISDLKEIIYDIYRELEEGKILDHDLDRLNVTVTLSESEQQIPVAVQPLMLMKGVKNALSFTQTLVEMNIPGKTDAENKKLKLDLCEQIVNQLYIEKKSDDAPNGCYIPFDIKPDNIGFDIDGENKITAVKIFDWSFPTKMLDEETVEGIAFELKNHCNKTLGISETIASSLSTNCIAAIKHQTTLLNSISSSGSSSSHSSSAMNTNYLNAEDFNEFMSNKKELLNGFFEEVNGMDYGFLRGKLFGYKNLNPRPSAAQFILKK